MTDIRNRLDKFSQKVIDEHKKQNPVSMPRLWIDYTSMMLVEGKITETLSAMQIAHIALSIEVKSLKTQVSNLAALIAEK